jgi:hypothetical protein
MPAVRREAFGWAPDRDGVWHRIEALGGFAGRWDVGIGVCHTTVRDPQISEPPDVDEQCRECIMVERLPEIAEFAWGEPDDHLHVLTPGHLADALRLLPWTRAGRVPATRGAGRGETRHRPLRMLVRGAGNFLSAVVKPPT